MAAVEYSNKRSGCYLGESNALNQINEEIVLLDGEGPLDPGTILGQVTEGGVQTVGNLTAVGGNTGNGVQNAAPTADAGVMPGTYRLTIIEPAANGGAFVVERPDGVEDGHGNVGVAYNGSVNFTLNDGATDFVAGDSFTLAVSYASGSKYAAFDQDGNDGREVAAAILFHAADATDGDIKTVATVRGPATINGTMLTWPDDITDAEKAVAERQLRDKGLTILPQHAA